MGTIAISSSAFAELSLAVALNRIAALASAVEVRCNGYLTPALLPRTLDRCDARNDRRDSAR